MLPEDEDRWLGERYYILDERRNPVPAVTYSAFCLWRAQARKSDDPGITLHTARDVIPIGEDVNITVSTVFLGMDHNVYTEGPPVLWETMVFGGSLDEEQERYTSESAALEGHAKWLALALQSRGSTQREQTEDKP